MPPTENSPQSAIRPHFWKYVLTVLVTVLLTFSLTVGFGVMAWLSFDTETSQTTDGDSLSLSFTNDEATKKALDKLKTVYGYVNNEFYKDLSDAELLEAMTRGLVNELGNRYTMYLTAEQNAQIAESMSGNYVGIGAIVGLNQDGLVEITEVIEGSPAESAGILVGDLFIEVNGKDVTGLKDTSAVAALVRGEAGTTVEIVMYRPSLSKNIKMTAARQKITSANISSKMLSANLGYVQIREFSQGVADNFIAAMEGLQAQGASHIVFDLRNNSGGLADEVIKMLDYLLPEATIAEIKGRDKGQEFSEKWTSKASSNVPDEMRYAILINGMSASASELFSGCLRDNDKAYLIGEQSFGKGSGTITFELQDGSAINLTNFLYYLPDGESIEEIGLKPDQEVSLPDEAIGQSIGRLPLELDTQLSAAIDYLEKLN